MPVIVDNNCNFSSQWVYCQGLAFCFYFEEQKDFFFEKGIPDWKKKKIVPWWKLELNTYLSVHFYKLDDIFSQNHILPKAY